MADQLQVLLAKLRQQRAAFDGIPRESAVQIIEEAVGKILLLPGVEATAIAGGDAVAGVLLTAILPPAVPLASLGTKGVDLLLHAICAWLEAKYRKAIAEGDAVSG